MSYRDLISNKDLWDIYTLKIEYDKDNKDKHGRFNYKKYSEYVFDHPLVSSHIHDKLEITYPEEKQFIIFPSHDVDIIKMNYRHKILSYFYYLTNGHYKELSNFFFSNKDNYYLNFNEMMDLEEKYGAKSSFNFLADPIDFKGHRYEVERISDEIGNIIDRGWEVGLHGGYYTNQSLEKMASEKQTIEKITGKKITGFRGHYLKFNVPQSWEILSKIGIDYDSTLGYSNFVGFRNGMCYPFKPYNRNTNSKLDIIEIPLILMDSILFEEYFLRKKERSWSDVWNMVKGLCDIVIKLNGVFSILFHNDSFSSPFKSGLLKLYEKLLKYGTENNALITSGDEICNIWNRVKHL